MFLQITCMLQRYKPIMVCTFALIVNPKVTVDQYLHLPKNLVCCQNIIFWEVAIELTQRTHCWLLINQSET